MHCTVLRRRYLAITAVVIGTAKLDGSGGTKSGIQQLRCEFCEEKFCQRSSMMMELRHGV